MTQAELANALGVNQATVSELSRDVVPLSLDRMARIEQACGRPPGFILRQAGYLGELDLEAAILTAPELDDAGRRAVLGALRGVLALGGEDAGDGGQGGA